MTENKNRVCCLYRVSTDKQVDFNSNHEADLPMQRKACHKFAEAKGWVIVHEEQEEGVSGHKVRAEARDKLQIIKEYARKGKFDILLVFMFDRIGRIADETPFVVEWFVRNGIRVWSTQEGEQRFDNHTDKLLNYIRFWQADGESEKTSVRTRGRRALQERQRAVWLQPCEKWPHQQAQARTLRTAYQRAGSRNRSADLR